MSTQADFDFDDVNDATDTRFGKKMKINTIEGYLHTKRNKHVTTNKLRVYNNTCSNLK